MESVITVIIVNYNVKEFLLQCLRSIEKASKGLTVETIVVDNNSTDGSVEFLQPLFPQVVFIKLEENIGFGCANNEALKKAQGKFILILNPDTLLSENTLQAMLDYMNEHTEVGIAGCKVINPDGSFQVACRRGFPTPWTSFTKLFGLQKIFPKSKIFGKYNQTFRSIDDTYYVDAVVGAFMFCRKEMLEKLNGFDTDFFMYGEDIDLCYRANQAGWKTAYYPGTTIIHYKGESTRRSSINELKHFYRAMEIFVKKHYSSSFLFLSLLRIGITIRSWIAYFNKYRRDIIIILLDVLAINSMLLVATKIRFGKFFDFPDYAYPTVFVALTSVLLFSMIVVGDYFETKPTVRKSFIGLMLSFFILSSLTYFFKEYAFSRGIVLMTIGFTMVIVSFYRVLLTLYDKISGKESDRKILIVGINEKSKSFIESIRKSSPNANIFGAITTRNEQFIEGYNLNIVGSIDYLDRIITDNNIDEVIITDETLSTSDIMKLLLSHKNFKAKIHIAQEYEELIAARIINDIAGIEPTIPQYNIIKFRYRFIKRFFDIIISIFLLTIGFPVVYLRSKNDNMLIKRLFLVLKGETTFIGLYPSDHGSSKFYKDGFLSLAKISGNEDLSTQSIEKLNDYYLKHFSLSLDTDILIKYLFRKKIGN